MRNFRQNITMDHLREGFIRCGTCDSKLSIPEDPYNLRGCAVCGVQTFDTSNLDIEKAPLAAPSIAAMVGIFTKGTGIRIRKVRFFDVYLKIWQSGCKEVYADCRNRGALAPPYPQATWTVVGTPLEDSDVIFDIDAGYYKTFMEVFFDAVACLRENPELAFVAMAFINSETRVIDTWVVEQSNRLHNKTLKTFGYNLSVAVCVGLTLFAGIQTLIASNVYSIAGLIAGGIGCSCLWLLSKRNRK